MAIAAAVMLVVAGLVVALVLTNDTVDKATQNRVASPTQAPTTAPAPVTAPVDLSPAVFPAVTSSQRFADPVSAAQAFATDYLGFVSPVVGEFRAGDSRSGEVVVRAKEVTAPTTISVRKLGDTWWVLGASTANIQVTRPAALETVSSPVALQGTSTAFEATVSVEIRDDADRTLGKGYVMGGGNGVMGPFNGSQAFTASSTPSGAVVLATFSSEDGRLIEASVVRVRFATATR